MGNVRWVRVVNQYSLVPKELDGLLTSIRVHNKGHNIYNTQGSAFANALGQGEHLHTLDITASAKVILPCAHNHAAKFRFVPFLFPSQIQDLPGMYLACPPQFEH
jgi:hypothetical protein